MVTHTFDYFEKGYKKSNMYTAFNDSPKIKLLKDKFHIDFDAAV